MADGRKNLMLARADKSVWDEPGFAATLSTFDRERLMAAAWGSLLTMVGVSRRGFAGGLLAMGGLTVAIRAAMGRRDLSAARDYVDRTLQEQGWRRMDIVSESSDESFPASDSPSWTSGSGRSR